MNDDGRDLDGLTDAERALAERLARLGGFMREEERATAEIDTEFSRHLRAHLVHGEDLAPSPSFTWGLRRQLVGEAVTPPAAPRQWLGRIAVAAALLVALLVSLPRGGGTRQFPVPVPSRADLLFSFPAPPLVIHHLTPTASLVHPAAGIPYHGRLTVIAHGLPSEPATLPAYRLAERPGLADRGRRLLDIRGKVHLVSANGTTWAEAADGGASTGRPLHSLAVSLATGELIYHDRRNALLARSTRPLGRSAAIAAARRWLTRLGWVAQQLPLRTFDSPPGQPKVRRIIFGWPGVSPAATEEATLWVTPDGSIVEGWVWPPIARRGSVSARGLIAAWDDVRLGRVPLAVLRINPRAALPGIAVVDSVRVVPVLAPGRRGLYLVPAYRFGGHVSLRSTPGSRTWYSLAPGVGR